MSKLIIVGFGAQAKAWALNLRDSKKIVHIALREGSPSHEKAQKMGFETFSLGPGLSNYDRLIMLTPDSTHHEILQKNQTFIKTGCKVIYAHGYSYSRHPLKSQFPRFDHLLLAPKGIASEVRFQYESGGNLAAVFSTEGSRTPEEDQEFLKSLAKDLGITVGPFPTTFEQETIADLFSEQSLLCSLLPYSALFSFNKLREKGISPELAYLECWYEVKLIVDTLIRLGPKDFFNLISPNALIGSEKAKNMIFDKHFSSFLDNIYQDIANRKFYQEVDSADYSALKKKVLEFWDKQELNQYHTILKDKLFSTTPS